MDVSDDAPIVIDNGCGMVKAGFAGHLHPKLECRNFVGRVKHDSVMPSAALGGTTLTGPLAQEHLGLLRIQYPMADGVVTNWKDMEFVWNHLYEGLEVSSEKHPVIVTETPLNPRSNRNRVAEVFFERYRVPKFFSALQAVLNLYSGGRTTGVVLDSGECVTHAVPIVDGFPLREGIIRMDLAGRDVTKHLQYLLRAEDKHRLFRHSSSEQETARSIKERCCYVALDPTKEVKEGLFDRRDEDLTFKLPDGTSINVGMTSFMAPEVLFKPHLIGEELGGVHDLLSSSVRKCDRGIRKLLLENIVLAGGTTQLPGFGNRLKNELRKLEEVRVAFGCVSHGREKPHVTPIHYKKSKIFGSTERSRSAWVGGSLLASMPQFSGLWVTRREYEEEGSRVLDRKGLL